MHKTPSRLYGLLIFCFFLLVGCSSGGGSSDPDTAVVRVQIGSMVSQKQVGRSDTPLLRRAAGIPVDVESILLLISAPDFPERREDIPLTTGEGVFTVLAGKDRTFQVQALNQRGQPIFQSASQTRDLVPESRVTLTFQLEPEEVTFLAGSIVVQPESDTTLSITSEDSTVQGLTIFVPAGAVAEPVTLLVEEVNNPANVPSPPFQATTIVELRTDPPIPFFTKTISLDYPYNETLIKDLGLVEEDLRLLRFSPQLNEWIGVANQTTNLADNVIQAEITSLSLYTIGVSSVVNIPPVAVDDRASTEENTPVTIAVLVNDSDEENAPLTIIGVTQGTNGSVVINADNTVTYTPNPEFTGVDTFTYTISDNAGGNATATVTVTVIPVNNPPVVESPGDQFNAEGDTVSLQLVASDPDEEDILTFSAANLPPGLSINPTTGLIAGTLPFTAAVTSPYTVTVSVSDGALDASTTFIWTVTNTNRPPIVESPGDQFNAEGDTVSLQLVASDPDEEDILTFSAANLPPGLSINPATGLIAGTVANGAASGSPYNVTVTVSDGIDSDTASFSWIIRVTCLPNQVCVVSPATPVSPGAEFVVTVHFNAGETGIISYLLKLSFNPAVVEVLDIEGVAPFDTVVTDSAAFSTGTVLFAANISNLDSPANGVITLANITFRVIGNSGDMSSLILDFAPVVGGVSVIVDKTFQPREDITFINGSVNVQ